MKNDEKRCERKNSYNKVREEIDVIRSTSYGNISAPRGEFTRAIYEEPSEIAA